MKTLVRGQAPIVTTDQREKLERSALGLGGIDECPLDIAGASTKAPREENYLFRAKTLRGLLARSSADMPACFRGAYSVLRQLRPFSVLARMETPPRAGSPTTERPPFEHIGKRLQLLLEGISSAQTARDVVMAISDDQVSGLSLDERFVNPGQTHPINTFGKLTAKKTALYHHENAWLWNERGVIALAQGKMYDAMPFFNKAARSLAEHEGQSASLSPGMARIQMNMAATWIERGNLRPAEELLHRVLDTCGEQPLAARANGEEEDAPDQSFDGEKERFNLRRFVRPVATGYLGLISHLQGDMNAAIKLYSTAIEHLEPYRQNRAVSIFCKHRADAFFTQGDPRAENEVNRAVSAAQSMMQIDQLHFAYLSRVRQLLGTTEALETLATDKRTIGLDTLTAAERLIHAVKKYSTDMGLYRLSCEAMFYDAKLKGMQRQFETACRSASESVAIAAKHGMKIRRISGSILLGELICRNGDRATGQQLLEDAGEAAQRVGYQLAVERQQQAVHLLEL